MSSMRFKGRRGQTLVIGSCLFCVLLGVAALTVDIGYIGATRARLQNTSDAAALAAMHELVERAIEGTTPDSAQAAARAECAALKNANHAAAAVLLEFGQWDADTQQFTPATAAEGDWLGDYPTALRATASRDDTAPGGKLALFFAPILGLCETNVRASTVVRVTNGILGFTGGLAPFAVYEGDILPKGQTMTFYDDNTATPGCFGLLDFDGGTNDTEELWDWIVNGYDGRVALDPETGSVWVKGTPGFREALHHALLQRLGEVLIIPVYDHCVDQGDNSQFRIVGFLALTITDFRLTGKDPYINGRVEELTHVYGAITGGPGSSNLYKVQLTQ